MSGLHIALEAITQKTDDLFALEINGIEIIFRLPSIRVGQQYTILLDLSSSVSERVEIYEALFRYVAEDEWLASNANTIPAGIPETISKLVLMLSGLDEKHIELTTELFQFYRKQIDSNLMYMTRVICQVFPGYTFESLNLLNYQKLVSIFIQAEKVLLDRGIIEKEHDFSSGDPKQSQVNIGNTIRNDNAAMSEFDSPKQEDPRVMRQMRMIREQAIQRAKEQEAKYKQQLAKQINK